MLIRLNIVVVSLLIYFFHTAQTAQQKSDQIWSKVVASGGKSAPYPGAFDLAYLFIQSMKYTVNTASDEFPPDGSRNKPIHSVGVIAKW